MPIKKPMINTIKTTIKDTGNHFLINISFFKFSVNQ